MRKVKRPGGISRRGRPPQISREAIVRAARHIVEGEGIDALTMRRLADALGVVPMAIYRHVRDKNELLVCLVDVAYNEMRAPRLPRNPRARLVKLWVFLHDGLSRYPWVVQAIVRSDVMAPSVLPQMEALLKAGIDCGLTVEQSADAYRIVWQYTVGAVMLRSAMIERSTAKRSSMVVQTLLSADSSAMPTLAAAARYWFAPPHILPYEEGVNRILDGALGR